MLFQPAVVGAATGALVIGEKETLFGSGDYAEKGLNLLRGTEAPEVTFS